MMVQTEMVMEVLLVLCIVNGEVWDRLVRM